MSFESDYVNLLIKQYWEQPNANAETALSVESYSRIYAWLDSFLTEFDVDLATGDRLDILGRVVGINRSIPYVLAKKYFGFSDNADAGGFSDGLLITGGGAPLFDALSNPYTELELDDSDYRFFIKAKVAKNAGSAVMVSDGKASIQDVINQTFSGQAFVIDNQDMSLTLYVSPNYRIDLIRAILALGLLPKPQGVQYNKIIQADPLGTFGFSDNVNAKGFSDALNFDPNIGGIFADEVIF